MSILSCDDDIPLSLVSGWMDYIVLMILLVTVGPKIGAFGWHVF